MSTTKSIQERFGAFREMSLKKQMLFLLPYILAIIAVSRIAELYRLCGGNLVRIFKNMEYLYKSVPHFAVSDLLIGIPAGFFIVCFVKTDRELHKKNTRPKEEYGSSR